MATVTEKQLQEGLQTKIQSLTAFTNDYVVINDYSLLDEKRTVEKIFIIENSDSPEALQSTGDRGYGSFTIPGTMAVRFDDWKESLNSFRDTRQEIFSLFNSTTGARSLGLSSVTVDSVTTSGAPNYLNVNDAAQLPIWITQRINFNVTLF
jgi:hypothetical protein